MVTAWLRNGYWMVTDWLRAGYMTSTAWLLVGYGPTTSNVSAARNFFQALSYCFFATFV